MTSETVTSPLLSQAYSYLQDGDAESAQLLIETYLDRNPEDGQAHHVAGLCYQALGDRSRARTSFEKAVALSPNEAGPAIHLAMAVADEHGPEAALSILDRALSTSSGNTDLLQARASLQRRAGDFEGAVATAQMALAFDRQLHYRRSSGQRTDGGARRTPLGSRIQKQMAKVKLLIIDELGFVPLSKTGAELLFELISQKYERGATLITSNLPFDEWTETFGTERLTGALLDRLTHHVNILEMNGESYRLAQSRARKATTSS